MLGRARRWLSVARECLRDPRGGLTRGLLSSVFALVVGLERVFPRDERDDLGFAVRTGGRRCPDRYAVGGWRRHLPGYEVHALCRRTSPWELIRGEAALLSYDAHASPRWTPKLHIPKGQVSPRNQHRRCDKLLYTYDLLSSRYLAVRATPGDGGLSDLAVPLLRQARGCGQPDQVHAPFDAGAGPSDAAVRTVGDLVAQEHPRLDGTRRACRHPQRVRRCKALPVEPFAGLHEPGPYVEAPPKEIRLAETTTVRKGETAEQAVRTVVGREVVRGPKKERWQPRFTTSLLGPDEGRGLFRLRPRHEQGQRVGVPDEFLAALPCGYDKESPDPPRPRWQRGPLPRRGWRVAWVYKAAAEGARSLAGDGEGCPVRSVRRAFGNRPGTLYQTAEALLVRLDRCGGQQALEPAVEAFNAEGQRLPWLENRQVVVSLTPTARSRGDP